MILTGLLGYLSCACAAPPNATASAETAASAANAKRFMSSSAFLQDIRRRSRRLDAVQAVRGVLAGEEHHVAVRRRLAGMHDVGWDVEERAGLGVDFLVADLGAERALQHVDPLLVG